MGEYSFRTGWSLLRQKDAADAKASIMAALKINTRMAWYNRLNGRVEPKVSEVKAIEAVFAKYGIKQIWD